MAVAGVLTAGGKVQRGFDVPCPQVLYVADAGVLTAGGNFRRSEAEPGAFDTPESAQLLLHNLVSAHADALGTLRTPDGASSLAEVGRVGVAGCCSLLFLLGGLETPDKA